MAVDVRGSGSSGVGEVSVAVETSEVVALVASVALSVTEGLVSKSGVKVIGVESIGGESLVKALGNKRVSCLPLSVSSPKVTVPSIPEVGVQQDEALAHRRRMEVYQEQMSRLNSRQVKAARLCAMQKVEPISNYSHMMTTVVTGGTFFGDMFGENTMISMTQQEWQDRNSQLVQQQVVADKFRNVLQQMHLDRELAKAAMRPPRLGGRSRIGRWSSLRQEVSVMRKMQRWSGSSHYIRGLTRS